MNLEKRRDKQAKHRLTQTKESLARSTKPDHRTIIKRLKNEWLTLRASSGLSIRVSGNSEAQSKVEIMT